MKIQSFLILIFIGFNVFSQETKVNGVVIDEITNEPVPFTNIAFKGTNVGTISSIEGKFFLSTRVKVDTLVASFIGYKPELIPIKNGVYQNLKIYLKQDKISLDEVVITPGENPAHVLLRKIIDNKKANNPDKITKYSCKIYNKMQLDANNLSERFKSRSLLKKFDFVFDYIDTSVVTGKNYLPILISESYSDFYYRKNPNSQKEVVTAFKVSGIENKSLAEYTGQMYQKVNFYDNNVNVLDRSFISPISSVGKAYYKYYLLDSAFVDNNWCYQISFVPKFTQEPTFDGYFWVADTTFALKSIESSLSKGANINLIQNFYLKQDFVQIGDAKDWMLSNEKLVMDFNVTDKTMGFFARKTTHYSDIKIDENIPDSIFSVLNSRLTIIDENAKEVSDEDWNELRHEKLNKNELGIYNMVDSIKNMPIFLTYIDVAKAIFSGFYDFGKIEFGDYTSLFSFNTIEGSRYKLMARSSTGFSEKIYLDGYLAYGSLDERFKYGFGARYYFRKDLTRSFGFKYKKDIEQLGISPYSLPSDNFLSALFSRTGSASKLTNNEEYKIFGKYEWFKGYTNSVSFNHRIMSPHEGQGLFFNPKDDVLGKNEIVISEISFNTRIAFNERTVEGRDEKIFITSKYPVVNINYTIAPKGALNSNYNFQRLQLSWLHMVKVNPLGYFRYYIEVGKIFGTVPYPLLEMHNGNETYWYDEYAFNLMNYYEFISDEWVSFNVSHHFEGFFLNKIPLIKKLKWREVASFKSVIGNMSEANKNYSIFPATVQEANQPYMEGSLGIENIFKIIRVDALWRLSHLDSPNISKFGIRVKLQFEF